jgi:hypothetical protein
MIVVLLAATFSTMRKIFFMEGLWPMMSLNAVWEGELMGMILPGVPSVLLMGYSSRVNVTVALRTFF